MDTSLRDGVEPAPSAADRVYQFVKDGIITRRLTSVALLGEGDLAAQVGVSRTPVREALLRLEAEGLVRLLPKRGVLVVPVTPAEIADVLETRRLIEAHTARKVAVIGASPGLIEELSRDLDAMRSATLDRDTAAYVRADRAFHAAVVGAAGNAILTGIYSSLRDRQLRMGVANLLDEAAGHGHEARMTATLVEHQAIFDALRAGDVAAVAAAVTTHLASAEHALRDVQ